MTDGLLFLEAGLVSFYADLLADFYTEFLARIGDFFDFVEEFYAVFLKEEDDC